MKNRSLSGADTQNAAEAPLRAPRRSPSPFLWSLLAAMADWFAKADDSGYIASRDEFLGQILEPKYGIGGSGRNLARMGCTVFVRSTVPPALHLGGDNNIQDEVSGGREWKKRQRSEKKTSKELA